MGKPDPARARPAAHRLARRRRAGAVPERAGAGQRRDGDRPVRAPPPGRIARHRRLRGRPRARRARCRCSPASCAPRCCSRTTIDRMLAEALPADWPMARSIRCCARCCAPATAELRDGRRRRRRRVVINEYLDVAHGFFTGDEPRHGQRRCWTGWRTRCGRGSSRLAARAMTGAAGRIRSDRPPLPPARRAGRARPRRRRGGVRPAAGPRTGDRRRRHGGGRAFPARRSARPDRAQAAADEPLRPRGDGGGAARLSDDARRRRATRPDAWFAGLRGRAGGGPGGVRADAARRRHHLDRRAGQRCR